MRIVIDLQGAQSESRFRGIGRYSLSIARALAEQKAQHELWLVLNAQLPDNVTHVREVFFDLLPQERIRFFSIPQPTKELDLSNLWRARAAEILRRQYIEQLKPDAVLITSLFEGYLDNAVVDIGGGPEGALTAVILYDLIPYLNPSQYLATPDLRSYYSRKILSLQNADLLLAISEHSRLEAVEALKLIPDKVTTISTAVDSRFHPAKLTNAQCKSLRDKYKINRDFLMYAPGGFDARKNLNGLICAYGLLPEDLQAKYQLVIVSRMSESSRDLLKQFIEKSGLTHNEVVLAGFVSDEDLISMYRDTSLFVFPSKHEGFGLPALEAMACGAPVIGSNSTSIPEVIGWTDALFDPTEPSTIAKKIEAVLSKTAFHDALTANSRAQATRFSWDQTARLTLDALQRALNQRRSGTTTLATSLPNASQLVQAITDIQCGIRPTDSDLMQVANCIAFNSRRTSSNYLFLDISEIVRRDAKSGIQRVVRSLLGELLRNPPQGYLVKPIYFDAGEYFYANVFVADFMGMQGLHTENERVDFYQDDIYLALDLNAHLTQAVHHLYMNLARRGVRLFFVVYDILLVHRPDWWPAGTSEVFSNWLQSVSSCATGLICISEAVAVELRQWIITQPTARLFPPKVRSFHLGADVENSAPSNGLPANANAVLQQLKLRSTILMVGTLEPRKGHKQALEAFEMLWEQGKQINLVIVGKQGWLVDGLCNALRQHRECGKRLFWLEGISDEYLLEIYAASACLLSASEGEGFGLPLIEAAQHNLPLIVRDLPVFHEVAGEHAYYFVGLDADDLAQAIVRWLLLYGVSSHPKSEGMPALTWQQSAKQLIACLAL
jgi:glycosyltransferase involved in cell wall biosynthesis